jgi:hypothetical protein
MSKPKLEERFDFSLGKIMFMFFLQFVAAALFNLYNDKWKDAAKNIPFLKYILIFIIVCATVIIIIEEGRFNLLRYISYVVILYIVIFLSLELPIIYGLVFAIVVIIYIQYNIAIYNYKPEFDLIEK